MDWSDSAVQATFRNEVRSVIVASLPVRYHTGGGSWEHDRRSENPEAVAAASAWSDALAERGWIAPHWPKEYGGAGLSPMEQFIFKQEMSLAAAPSVGGQGVSQLGPTLIVHGTDEQKAEHLPKICQERLIGGKDILSRGRDQILHRFKHVPSGMVMST